MVSFAERIDGFLNKRPRLKRVLYFLKHPTTLRVAALLGGVVTAILSGGATIPVVALAGIFATSCFSIIMETVQVRRKNNLLLQKAMLDGVVARKRAFALKYGTRFLDLDRALLKREMPALPSVKVPSRTGIMLRTIGAIGLESIFPIGIAAASMNVPGAIAYAAGLALAVGRVGMYTGAAAYAIKGDFDTRLTLARAQAELKRDISGLARSARVSPFRTTAALSKSVDASMREMDALAAMCEATVPPGGERAAFEKELAARPEPAGMLPKRPSLIGALLEGLNPFTTKDRLRVDHDPFGDIRARISHIPAAPSVRRPVAAKTEVMSPEPTPSKVRLLPSHQPPARGGK